MARAILRSAVGIWLLLATIAMGQDKDAAKRADALMEEIHVDTKKLELLRDQYDAALKTGDAEAEKRSALAIRDIIEKMTRLDKQFLEEIKKTKRN